MPYWSLATASRGKSFLARADGPTVSSRFCACYVGPWTQSSAHIISMCQYHIKCTCSGVWHDIKKNVKVKGFCSHCSLFVYNIINIFWKSLLLRASRTVSIVSTIANHNRELSSICHPDFLQPDACNGTMFRRPQAPRKAITAASAVPLMKPSAVHKVGFLMLWTEGYIMIWTDLNGFDGIWCINTKSHQAWRSKLPWPNCHLPAAAVKCKTG